MGIPLRPPRLTGDPASDSAATVEYLWLWYRNIVEEQEYVRTVDVDVSVINDPQLAALAVLEPTVANNLPYFTSADEAALAVLAAFGLTFLASATAADGRNALQLSALATASFGTGAGTAVEGNDGRLLSASEKTDLTDGNDSAAHFHATDRDRANHSGTQAAETISGLAAVATSGAYADLSGKPIIKAERVTTGSIGAASTALITLAWAVAFADANYTPQASVLDSTTSSLSLSVVHVESWNASSVSVRIINNAAGAITGTLLVTAIHD